MKFLNYDRVLCLSPHPDDVEYGMLGTILKYKDTNFQILNVSRGGDFDDWKPNGVAPPDHVIKQLSKVERAELIVLIQECQIVNPKKPSSSA